MIPSILAIAAKVLLIVFGRDSLRNTNRFFLLFLFGMCGVNIIELTLFSFIEAPQEGLSYLILYYNFCLLSCCALLIYCFDHLGKSNLIVTLILILVFGVTMLLTWIPELMIIGARSIGYSVTKIEGPFYIALITVLLIGMSMVMGLLGMSVFSKNTITKCRGIVLLISLVPLFVCATTIIISMALGGERNATIFTSICTSFMMGVLIFAQKTHRLFKLVSFVPGTAEFKFSCRILEIANSPRINLKEAKKLLTDLMMQKALDDTNNIVKDAAVVLGCSKQTIYDWQKQKES